LKTFWLILSLNDYSGVLVYGWDTNNNLGIETDTFLAFFTLFKIQGHFCKTATRQECTTGLADFTGRDFNDVQSLESP
jgi:hypothetical protein